MKLCFIGDSYAPLTLKEGARRRGFEITDNQNKADLVFVSQDTPTSKRGIRNLKPIKKLIESVKTKAPIILTSQVTPGFCRALNLDVIHQSETLRIEDGLQRAMYPEMFIVGMKNEQDFLPYEYAKFLERFDCHVFKMNYEDAEFTKIAINMTLASQVDNANRLSEAAAKCGADWLQVSRALRHDSRIGKYSYLTPGDWKKSPHLLRDWVTLQNL